MDTQVLFRDERRYLTDFQDMPSLMTFDEPESTDRVDDSTFSSEICSWNYQYGYPNNDFELMFDRFDQITANDGFHTVHDDYHTVNDDFRNVVEQLDTEVKEEAIEITHNPAPELLESCGIKEEIAGSVDTKPLLSNFDFLDQEIKGAVNTQPPQLPNVDDFFVKESKKLRNIKTEPNSTNIDTYYDVEHVKKEIIGAVDTQPPQLPNLNFLDQGIIGADDTKPPPLPIFDFLDPEIEGAVDAKPLLSNLDFLEQESKKLRNIKTEPKATNIDTHYDVVHIKKEIPGFDEITSVPFFEYSDFSIDNLPNNLIGNDLPPNLDLCSFINEDEIPITAETNIPKKESKSKATEINLPKKESKFKAGRKRIDLKAQKYIVGDEQEEEEEENIDVETVSECENNPVLEAGDLNSLLEQFEATEAEVKELPTISNVIVEKKGNVNNKGSSASKIVPSKAISDKNNFINKKDSNQIKNRSKGVVLDADTNVGRASSLKIEQKYPTRLKSKQERDKPKSRPTPAVVITSNNKQTIEALPRELINSASSLKVEQKYPTPLNSKLERDKPKSRPAPAVVTTSNNKQIIEALPRELINRIKKCGKRKGIPIIDPVPNSGIKKRKIQDSSAQSRVISTNNVPSSRVSPVVHAIELDHNYCTVGNYQKRPSKKDSGYISAEEEDKPLYNQPIVKNADGKLMISLLKINTVRSNNEENKKKKLNIEEYKKRRPGILNTPTSSQSNSPMSSSCSSPLPEDEETRRLKHEEKLRKMALELLNTPPKCINTIKPIVNNNIEVPKRAVVAPPDNMDVITYVSIGVNTDISGRHPFAPAEKLEEIKPLLKNASIKINSNSFINSLIENIPNMIKADNSIQTEKTNQLHGENKTIIYLPKNRKLPQSLHVEVQTTISLIGNKRRYRRRKDSSTSSCSSNGSGARSSRSHSSKYSKSSRSSRSTSVSSSSSSCRSRSRSRSRSPSPQRRRRKRGYDKEYVQEVEERRVVYVGKIAPKTTKSDLQKRFSRFGPIKTISLHFRDHGDNYGFVTFANKLDAFAAIEHGNDDPYAAQYDLSFGGRRLFCKTTYSDLDNLREDSGYGPPPPKPTPGESFDRLLKEMKDKLKRRQV